MNMEWWMWLFSIVIYIFLAVLLVVVPIAHSRSVLFGVYVPKEEREGAAASKARSRYVSSMLLVVLLGIAAAAAFGGMGYLMPGGLLAAMAVLTVGVIAAGGYARRSMLRISREQGWEPPQAGRRVADLNFRRRRLTIGNGWFAAHAVLIAVSVIYAIAMWDRIPDTFATHYDISGEADSYSAKSFGSVFMLNIVQLLMTGLFVFVNLSIRIAKQQLDPKQPEKSMDGQRRFRMANSIILYGLSLFVIAMIGYIQGTSLYGWQVDIAMGTSVALPVLVLAALLGMMFYFRKNDVDLSQGAGLEEASHWKLGGAFYYNTEDPSLFVAKRYGIGWTINMGQRIGWLVVAGIVAIPAAAIVVAVTLS